MLNTIKESDLKYYDKVYWYQINTHAYDWNDWTSMEAEDWGFIKASLLEGGKLGHLFKFYGVLRNGIFYHIN